MMELAQNQIYSQAPGYFKRLTLIDWLFALNRYGAHMDVYEKGILLAAAPTFAALGWNWKSVRWLMPLLFVLALFSISLYAGDLDSANHKFLLKYLLSSQSAILWMGTFFFFSTAFYWI